MESVPNPQQNFRVPAMSSDAAPQAMAQVCNYQTLQPRMMVACQHRFVPSAIALHACCTQF